ncbi:hypothetical protein XH92_41400 [Bradyrhizobium sp. CCBAU 53421]|nr:hypothetical protein XH92_41400 [Bradyrhizobium sp. CCBAU 53421]
MLSRLRQPAFLTSLQGVSGIKGPKKKTEEATMFVAIRVMILIASAYAGSAVAEMQFAPLPSLAASSAP